MKIKKIFIALTLFITSLSFGQNNTFPTPSGNVGIGTTTPTANLEVAGSAKISSYSPLLILQRDTDNGGFVQGIQTKKLDGTDNWFFGNYYVDAWMVSRGDFQDPKLTVLYNGNVGIGTLAPTAKLDIYTNLQSVMGRYDTQKWSTDNANFNLKLQTVFSNNGINQEFVQKFNGTDYTSLAFYQGNVGIGSSKPDQKLTVKGKIHAEEIIVDLNVPADYVFQKYYTGKSELKSDYSMPTLTEVAQFIKANNHLPNIPSAKEIQEKGMSLGEMNNLLLQKVEELTLYAIEQQNKAEDQNRTLEAQSKLLDTLAARLTNLEKK